MKNFLFSFIIPCWNAEEYISEAVESVLAQSIGFEKNIQIVLINDGSIDGTNAICEGYQKRHPDNIILIANPINGGASAARNMGLAAATGRYINFLDADDKWDTDTCRAALNFFEEYPHAHVACFPITLFGTTKGEHWLNEKFKETRLANIFEDPDCVVFNACTCFCEHEAVKNRFFDEQMQIAEDRLWLGKLLLDEQNFGLIAGPAYHYRKHPSQLSSLETTSCSLSYYLDIPRQCYLEIFRYAQERCSGEVPLWAQYAVMGDLASRLREKGNDNLTPLQKDDYRSLMQACLAQIEDSIILSIRNLWSEDRLYALALKYNMTYEQIKEWVKADAKRKILCFSRPENSPVPFSRPWALRVEFLEINKGYLLLRGCCAVLMPRELVHLVLIANLPDGGVQEYPCELLQRADLKKQLFFEEELWVYEGFELSIPLADLADGATIRAVEIIDGETFPLTWLHENRSPFSQKKEQYQTPNGSIIANLPDKQGICVETIAHEDSLRFQFSFVVPVWNEEECLAGAIESVITQTVGFEDNIQLVLVNDGSDDGTASICQDYHKRYPDNIVYIEQPHKGVSEARNAGLETTSGKYISFLDADDRLDANICQSAENFFDNHPWIHVVCSPIMLCGENEEKHPFNEQFETTTEVAHIFKNPKCAMFGPCSWFFEWSVIQGRLFGETLPISEDVVWTAKLLLDIQDFGQLSGSCYHKCERPDRNRSQEACRQFWSLELARLHYPEIFHHVHEKYGSIPQWAQFIVLPDLARRIREKDDGLLSSVQKEEYRSRMRLCLAEIDDEVILTATEFDITDRLCAFAVKYGLSCEQVKMWIEADGRAAVLNLRRPETQLLRFCDMPPLQVDFLDIAKGQLQLRGSFAMPAPQECTRLVLEVEFSNGDRRSYPCELVGSPASKTRLLVGEDPDVFRKFDLAVPLAELAEGVMVRAIANIGTRAFTLNWSHEAESLFNQDDGKKHQTQTGAIITRLPDNKGIRIESFSNFLFSFIIPAYNVKPYLAEAVESIIAQTVGFEHIQIVLVNDGSTDGTGALCKRYRDLYPDNIIYIDKPNGGVSSARNAGLRAATGKYINFLDADDKWDLEVCKVALDFFEKYPETSMLSFPMKFFERQNDQHWLNYKFTKTKVATILKDTDYALFSSCNTFYKSNIIRGTFFDEHLSIAEDALFVTKLLLEKQNFGVAEKPYYMYRKRLGRDSTLDANNRDNMSRYFETLRLYHLAMLRYSSSLYGHLIRWVQYSVMLDLTWRFKEKDTGFLTPPQKEEYRSLLRACLTQIDDQIICTVRNLWAEERLYTLAMKYNMTYEQIKEWVKPDEQKEALFFCRPGAAPLLLSRPWNFRVEFMNITQDQLLLRGSVPALISHERMTLVLEVKYSDGSVFEYPCALFRRPDKRKDYFFENGIWAQESFELSLPLTDMPDETQVQAFVIIEGIRFALKWTHDKLSPFVRGLDASYMARNGYIIGKLPDGKGLLLESINSQRIQKKEKVFLDEIMRKSPASSMQTARIRQAARRMRRLSKKPIWLICDRVPFAGDSGEALFEYLMANPETRQSVRPIFVLSKDSVDWERMKAIGPTVAYGSALHKILFLAADKIISSHADDGVINPFGKNDGRYRDLFNFDFVYLEHGVMLADVSRYLHRADKNIALFVTSAEREREAIVSGNFGYAPEQVQLTGQPRHDTLFRRAAIEKTQHLVALMPTWRSYLDFGFNAATGLSASNPAFAESDYFCFWNSLINHGRLLKALCEHGYRLRFVVHPRCIQEADKFQTQEPVEIVTYSDSTKNICEAALLVTDYSSTACEFALLKKPIIYAQFDADEFFSGRHSYDKGYFEYERDGFGPVCPDLETTVDTVINYLKNSCEMEPLYRERVDAFFGPQPESRCQLVVDAIKQLGRRPE